MMQNEDDTNTFELVSVEEFRDYYQPDNDISDEDIEGFIFDYGTFWKLWNTLDFLYG